MLTIAYYLEVAGVMKILLAVSSLYESIARLVLL